MKKFYPYIIAVCGFLLMFVNVGFPSTSFGVYQPYIVDSPGMDDAYGSLVMSLRNLSSLFTLFFVAHYYKKISCRTGIFIATLITAFGFLIFSFAQGPVIFCIASIVCGIGYGLGGSSAMTILISNWYDKNTGKPIGFSTIGSSIAGIVVPIIILETVSISGIHESFALQAIIAFSIAVFLFILVRNNPEEKHNKVQSPQTHNEKIVLSKGKYWLYVLGVFLVGGACLTDIYYLSILLSNEGAGPVVAAIIVSIENASLCVGKFSLGAIFDKFGTYKGTIISFIATFAGVALLCITPYVDVFIAYIGAILFGWGSAIITVGISQWSIDLSTEKNRENTVRDFQSAYAAGGFTTGIFPGLIAECIGSYVAFYIISGVMIIVSAIIILKLYPHHKRYIHTIKR